MIREPSGEKRASLFSPAEVNGFAKIGFEEFAADVVVTAMAGPSGATGVAADPVEGELTNGTSGFLGAFWQEMAKLKKVTKHHRNTKGFWGGGWRILWEIFGTLIAEIFPAVAVYFSTALLAVVLV
jgi:hypothetical protein